MSRVKSRGLLAVLVAVGMGVGLLVPLSGFVTPPVMAAPLGQDLDACVVTHAADAGPSTLLLGETVDVTLTVRPNCPQGYAPLHIVFVFDASGSMIDEPSRELKKAARQMIIRLDLQNHPNVRIGVVMFHSEGRILCQLTNRSGQAAGCVGRVGAAGGTNVGAGIDAGMQVLVKGRQDFPADFIREVLVVVTNGGDKEDCPETLAAAGRAKAQDVLLISVCTGADCDAQCMRSAATSPRYFFETPAAAGLADVFERIRQSLVRDVFVTLVITGTVPAGMELVADSSKPAPAEISPGEDAMIWHFDRPPTTGVTVSWRVRPLDVGRQGVGLSTYGLGPIGRPPSGETAFVEPHVLVMAPREVPTATPGGTMPGPTATPTPTTSATPTPTADVKGVELFFPLALRDVVWR